MSAPVFSQDGLTIRVQYQSRRRYEKTDSLCVRGYEIPRPHGGNGEKGVKSKLTKKYKNEKPSFLSMTVFQRISRRAITRLEIFCVKKHKFLKPAQRPARSTSPSTYKRTGKVIKCK